MALKQIPLTKRPVDIALIVFFIINFFFITYMIDVEQLVIADPNNFTYPVWPPRWLVDLVHWYGKNFDPVLMANAAWVIFPVIVLCRMWRSVHPFTEE